MSQNDNKGFTHTRTHTRSHTQISLPAAQANYRAVTPAALPSAPSTDPLCFYALNDIIVWLRCRLSTAPLNAAAPASSSAAAAAAADGR